MIVYVCVDDVGGGGEPGMMVMMVMVMSQG